MKLLFTLPIVAGLLSGWQPATAQVDAGNGWQPGFWSCDQTVRRPIAHAWRVANYIDEEIAEIRDALADGGDCPDDETLDRMEQMIGVAYAPLRTALSRLAECEEYLMPGLFDLLRKRSADLGDRLFIAQRDLARLCR